MPPPRSPGDATSDRHARETNGHASIDREDAEIGRPRGAAAGYGQARRPGALDVGQAGGVAQVRQGGVERDRTGDGEVDRVIARGLVDLGDDIPQVPRETQAGARVSQAVDGEGRQQRPVFEAFQLQPPPGVGTPGRGNCDSDREVADHQRTMGSKRDIGGSYRHVPAGKAKSAIARDSERYGIHDSHTLPAVSDASQTSILFAR